MKHFSRLMKHRAMLIKVLFILPLFFSVLESNAQNGSINGIKFNDVNGDGIQNDAVTEPGLQNWSIRCQRLPDSAFVTDVTNGNGEYTFSNLIDGNYLVYEVQQPGWQQTAPPGGSYSLTISGSQVYVDKNFGNRGMGQISGVKYHDLNKNGVRNTGEPGIYNWTISLNGPNYNRSVFTDYNGQFAFTNLPVGTYTLSESPKEDWEQTEPPSPGTYTITVQAGQPIPQKNFGNFYTIGNISGFKFLDLRADGLDDSTFSPLDQRIGGWEIYLTLNGSPYASTTTNESGVYTFTNLPDGNYEISEEHPAGWIQTYPVSGDYNITISPTSRTFTNIDFGNCGTGSISGTAYYDVDVNCVQDLPTDYGLHDWGIHLQFSWLASQFFNTIYTDPSGYYQFNNLPPGDYHLVEIVHQGWQSICPVGAEYQIALTLGQPSASGMDFANEIIPASISGKKLLLLNGTATPVGDTIININGETIPVEGWTITLIGPSSATITTNDEGEYSFNNLPNGSYQVSEVPLPPGYSAIQPPTGSYTVIVNATERTFKRDFVNKGTSAIGGNVFYDINNNCIREIGSGHGNWKIKLTPQPPLALGPLYALTDEIGDYIFPYLPPGDYQVSEILNSSWLEVCSPPASGMVNLPVDQGVGQIDFGNTIVSMVQDLKVDIAPVYPWPLQSPCCNLEMTYLLSFTNEGTTPVSNAAVKIQLSQYSTYLSFSSTEPLLIFSQNGQELTWTIPDPIPLGKFGRIYVTVKNLCSQPFPLLVSQASVEPIVGDATPDNNTSVSSAQVACSHDPNDKSVTPKGCGAEGFITAEDTLLYVIRFQNTGNAPAYHVVIRDTLDEDLDISTINTISSSHSQVFEVNGREVVWTFWGIVLPDSETNEPESHGYVKFSIHSMPTIAPGAVIENRAGIYFDLNEPVITNTTHNTISTDPRPNAAFIFDSTCSGTGCVYNFTYTGGTTGATFHWQFGEGAVPETSSVENPTGITYGNAGIKLISLQVTNVECNSEPVVQVVEVQSAIPCVVNVSQRWNIVSVPVIMPDYQKSVLFTSASTYAYTYEDGYQRKDTLQNHVGYWLKFPGDETITLNGNPVITDSFDVNTGWNMIGSISSFVPVGTITSDPPGIETSHFFGYGNGYEVASTIEPGKGYWVKVNQPGKLILSSVLTKTTMRNSIKIIQGTELPPPPPHAEGNTLKSDIPDRFYLEKNYPNPFNPTTLIKFGLPVDALVTLKVYSLLGQEVARLLENNLREAGAYEALFNAQQLNSGLYFYRITAQEKDGKVWSDVQKMILLK